MIAIDGKLLCYSLVKKKTNDFSLKKKIKIFSNKSVRVLNTNTFSVYFRTDYKSDGGGKRTKKKKIKNSYILMMLKTMYLFYDVNSRRDYNFRRTNKKTDVAAHAYYNQPGLIITYIFLASTSTDERLLLDEWL